MRKDTSSRFQMGLGVSICMATLALAALLSFPGETSAQAQDDAVTFARDVAPIIQEKCETCHRDGSIGPHSMTNYEEIRPWAPLIKEKVTTREMPPWPSIRLSESSDSRTTGL